MYYSALDLYLSWFLFTRWRFASAISVCAVSSDAEDETIGFVEHPNFGIVFFKAFRLKPGPEIECKVGGSSDRIHPYIHELLAIQSRHGYFLHPTG
jgi:hypothetical protein